MIKINENFLRLQSSYLFSDIASRIKAYEATSPERPIIKMGIGDVKLPLPAVCVEAMHKAVDEMGEIETFRGYGPEQGYDFLREAIAQNDFQSRGANIVADEIFISDGSKCDTANIQELFDRRIKIAVPDPVYPVYVDTNVMAGRTGDAVDGRYKGLVYLNSTSANKFVPKPPQSKVDLIYLCFPNNPTGATATREDLALWVNYALENKALILFDAAYEAFIRDPQTPHSIFEIEGARKCAIEFRSFSKTAGFTGTRCAYTVIPKECVAYNSKEEPVTLHQLWNRRHTTKFNGVSYPVQRAAAAIYTPEGKKQVTEIIDYYLVNAALIRDAIRKLGFRVTGGTSSPYLWVKVGGNSWDFFDKLLKTCQIVVTPGAGFGRSGEGYIRISAFQTRNNVLEAIERLKKSDLK